jgi:hypothetical protein
MPRKSVSVEIPRDPSDGIALLKEVKAEHGWLGEGAPLKVLEWDKIGLGRAPQPPAATMPPQNPTARNSAACRFPVRRFGTN